MVDNRVKNGYSDKDKLPEIILLKSQNPNVDRQKKSNEIRYYLTQIILLGSKKGRPSREQFSEVNDAA